MGKTYIADNKPCPKCGANVWRDLEESTVCATCHPLKNTHGNSKKVEIRRRIEEHQNPQGPWEDTF